MTRDREPIYKTLSAPFDIQVEITTACDNNCVFCYNFWREDDILKSTLSSKQLSYIIDQLASNNVFYVTFTGGEPLLFSDAVLAAIEQAAERNISSSINSNLTHLTPERALALKEAGISSILTSLVSFDESVHDAITQNPGSYQKTLQGIKIAQQARIPVAVNMPVSKLNKDHVYETGGFVASLGIDSFCATKASPPLGNESFFDIELSDEELKVMLADLLRLESDFGLNVDALEAYPLCFIQDLPRFEKFTKRKCQAALTTCTIGPDGSIRPCSHADRIYGNIFSDSLRTAWEKMQEWRDGSLIPETCHSCGVFSSCGGGCRVNAQSHGDITGIDPLVKNPEEIIPQIKTISFPPACFGEKQLSINPYLRFREEEFGGAVDGRKGQPAILNQEAFKTLMNLRERQEFSIAALCEESGFSKEETEGFFWHLFNQQVVLERSS